MKDRAGFEYEELLAYQSEHLAQWQRIVIPELFAAVSAYVLAANQPATTPEEKHRVYRGADLSQIIFTWPNLGPAYAPIPTVYQGI